MSAPAWTKEQTSRYLKGNYAPVDQEHDRQAAEIAVGQIPAFLRGGAYARNGPNPHFAPPGTYHWFDGDGMVHAVYFEDDGSVSYANKWVKTSGFKYENEIGRGHYYGLGDFGSKIVSLLLDGIKPWLGMKRAFNKKTSNTALVFHDAKLMALVENGMPMHIAAHTLETIGRVNYGGKLDHAVTAHPKVDPVTGELFAFGYNLGTSPAVQYFRVTADGEKMPSVPITLHQDRAIMMHDFATTSKHAVFLDFPYVFSLSNIVSGKSPLSFDETAPARIGVLPRDAADQSAIQWFDVASPCYAFHVANSWVEGDTVVVLACRMEKLSLELLGDDAKEDDGIDKGLAAHMHEWRLNTADGTVTERRLSDINGEFPVCDEQNRWGYKSRFVWFAGSGGKHFNALHKMDLVRGTTTSYDLPDCHFNDEFVFVNTNAVQYKGDYDPTRDPESPDDGGVLLGYVYDESRGTSYLLILNAATMKEVAKVDLPARVPHGFHGKHITKDQLASAAALLGQE